MLVDALIGQSQPTAPAGLVRTPGGLFGWVIDSIVPGAENDVVKSLWDRLPGTAKAAAMLLMCLVVLTALAACGGEQMLPAVATTAPATP